MASAPTIDDARTAGRALTGAGAREVLAFGSVARGDADPHSDIDLVVILDDLEYRRRRDAAEALEKLAAGATGAARGRVAHRRTRMGCAEPASRVVRRRHQRRPGSSRRPQRR